MKSFWFLFCVLLFAGCGAPTNLVCFEDSLRGSNLCFERVYTQRMDFVDIEVADLDRDGDSELIEWGYHGVWIVEHRFGGAFRRQKLTSLNKRVTSLLAKDVNNDNLTDILISLQRPGSPDPNEPLLVFLNQPDGEFTQLPPFYFPYLLRQLQAGDFNHDDILDLAAISYNEDGLESVVILRGQGDGTFIHTTEVVLWSVHEMKIVDLDQDQFSDILFSRAGDADELSWVHNQGDPAVISFDEAERLASIDGGPNIHSIIDLDQDGTLDVLIETISDAFILFGQQELVSLGEAQIAQWITAADLNRDQRTDLFVSGLSDFKLLIGQGDGTFVDAPSLSISRREGALEHRLADINGDSLLDLILEDFDVATIYLAKP